MPVVWKASVYRRQTRTATCLTCGRRVFTGDKQEQPRAFGMASVYRRNKYSHMPLVWKVSVYTRTATKFPGYLQIVAVIR